jgi:hypothetical protein
MRAFAAGDAQEIAGRKVAHALGSRGSPSPGVGGEDGGAEVQTGHPPGPGATVGGRKALSRSSTATRRSRATPAPRSAPGA